MTRVRVTNPGFEKGKNYKAKEFLFYSYNAKQYLTTCYFDFFYARDQSLQEGGG